MPRPRRVHAPGGLYHAILRGNHQAAIFADAGDYRAFESILTTALERYAASVFAYCWMPNHVHLAIRVADAPLGDVMRIVASRYARRVQRAVPTTGHLFERRYRARLVDGERYLLTLVRYIHLNPVRAGLAADARDYRWSSHRAYLGERSPAWLRVEPVLARFGSSVGGARAAYRGYMGEPGPADAAELEAIRVGGPRPREHVGNAGPPTRAPLTAAAGAVGPRGLDAIAAEVAGECGIAVEQLLSPQRHSALVRARAEVARRALREGAGTLSGVARYLGRSPSTLSELLRVPVLRFVR